MKMGLRVKWGNRHITVIMIPLVVVSAVWQGAARAAMAAPCWDTHLKKRERERKREREKEREIERKKKRKREGEKEKEKKMRKEKKL